MHFDGNLFVAMALVFIWLQTCRCYLFSILTQNFRNYEARDCEKDIGESDGSLLWYHVCFAGL